MARKVTYSYRTVRWAIGWICLCALSCVLLTVCGLLPGERPVRADHSNHASTLHPQAQIGIGTPPLVLAAEDGDLERIKALLAKGADPNASDIPGYTALFVLVGSDAGSVGTQYAIARLLLNAGTRVNERTVFGETVLHYAVMYGGDRLPLVKLLLDRGAHVNVRDTSGFTPLMQAAYPESGVNIVKALLAKGARVNAQNDEGLTPLMMPAQVGEADTLRVLLHAGADVNAADAAGNTALLHAAERLIQAPLGRDAIEVLLGAGADPNARDKQGHTPRYWARRNHRPDIVRLLRKAVSRHRLHGPARSLG